MRRRVHYVSGALLATPAELFRELGGFGSEYAPGYYEDTDYCFRIRERGMPVVYEPRATVVHLEGGTAGTSEARGMKRYQAINRDRFRERWAKVLSTHPKPPSRWDDETWHRLAKAGR
jgi:GT2 family glycosyltransferase